MKIALMGAWNTDSGASIHAELIGRAWVEKGIDLKVFSFYRHSFHGTALTKKASEEENYVTRCFTVYGVPNPEMNTAPVLDADFDVFVVEDLGMLPMANLLQIFPQIKKKAKTVNIVHDGKLSTKPEYFKFDWDHVVCFDDRYYRFLEDAYPEGKVSIIPYPSCPLVRGDQKKARKELGLPPDKKIVLLFGQASDYALNTSVVLDRLTKKYDVMLVLVTEAEKALAGFKRIKPKVAFDLKIVERSPDQDLLYKYLYAADCMIYNKPSMPIAVVGSTVFQCMGSGCPIIALESNFVYPFNREVFKYRDFYELEECLVEVFEKGPRYQAQQKAIEEYLADKSAEPTAEKFLELFEILLGRVS
ncbi:MAG: hypothetical protein GF409_05360 [Candidatus Omnitrophica bacterium]|nr:hypothetical protein [Candidatus Omnitrophota bacterium]